MKTLEVKKKKKVLNESVQVVVRCRPISKKEESENNEVVIEVWPQRGVIEITNPKSDKDRPDKKVFTYDAVYDSLSTQQDIYDMMIRPLVSSVLEGFNGCVFAYGQTGTGKTYTMEGILGESETFGIIPRSFEHIWGHINCTKNMEVLVTVSYLEIHLEEVKDLLKTDHKERLEIREMPDKGVHVPKLHTVTCRSAEDMLRVMKIGNKNRSVGCTQMNEHSSRSHAIFTIRIEMCDTDTQTFKVGKLNLVDLAGSERQSKTGAVAVRLKEASKINRALSALGNVISALAENSQHVPYRDSKLTRLLQDSLGGNSKTIMIANIGPADYNYEESLTTLRYAHRAKTIQNQPVKNEDPKDVKIREYQSEIERLKKLIEERKQEETVVVKKIKKKKAEIEDNETASSVESVDPEEESKLEEKLRAEREKTDELADKLKSLENQLVRGGKNILDSVNEKQIQLEHHLNEIAERKKREIEMQQQLELEEETNIEIREGYSNLQQEVEMKSRKLKKLYGRYMALKQESVDIKEEYNKDRREMEATQEALVKELKLKMMIMDNFIPIEDKEWMLNNARYDDNIDDWVLPPPTVEKIKHRPCSRNFITQPTCDYTLEMRQMWKCPARYKTENILRLLPYTPMKTTQNYKRPEVSPSMKAVVNAALENEQDLIIDDESARQQLHARTQATMDVIEKNMKTKRSTTRANTPKITSGTTSVHSRLKKPK